MGLIGGIGLGLGVRAKGLSGICPTDFRLDGECNVLAVLTPNLCLCFSPCKELGRVWVAVTVTGEHGAESAGLEESEWLGSGVLVECLKMGLAGLREFKLCEPDNICISAVAFFDESLRNSEVLRRLSSRRLLDRGLAVAEATLRRAILIA